VELFSELSPRLSETVEKDVDWRVELSPSEPSALRVAVDAESESFTRDFALRQVPPQAGYEFAFVGTSQGLRLELGAIEGFAKTGHLWVALWTDYGHDSAQNLDASECLRMWVHRRDVLLTGALVGGSLRLPFPGGPHFTPGELAELESKTQLFRKAVAIETHFGRRLNFPLNPTVRDVRELEAASAILETGTGVMKYDPEPVVVETSQFAQLVEEGERHFLERMHVRVKLFDAWLDYGVAEYFRPRLRIVNIRPLGEGLSSPAEVTLAPVGDASVEWRLVGPPPRLAGAP